MISIKDIFITEKVRKILGSKGIRLSEITYKKLYPVLKEEIGYDIELYTNKNWNKFKQTLDYSTLMDDINELFELGYGCKFIALCLTIKYKIFTSFLMVHRRLDKDRLDIVINDKVFVNSDIIIKGRLIYSKKAKSFYLVFKCVKIRKDSQIKRIGVKVFFDTENKKIFLERDDRSAKKLMVHVNDLCVSLYPLPDKIKEFLKNTNKTYKSFPIELNFNSNNLGYKRYELIDDSNARLLFPYLQKQGFNLEKKRTTSMSRSKGDLTIYKNNKKLRVEITNIGAFSKKSHTTNHHIRDILIGKITRMCLSKDLSKKDKVIFILNNKLKNSIINEDFNNVISHFSPYLLFTDFNKEWEKIIAEKINNLFKSK